MTRWAGVVAIIAIAGGAIGGCGGDDEGGDQPAAAADDTATAGTDVQAETYWGKNPFKHNSEYGGALVFVLGIAAAAGAIGQSRAIVAACEGIARNPGAAGPIRLVMIIGLALIESLVIYALLIAFLIREM